MNDKKIKKLALSSYINNKLDKKRVDKITKYLSKLELKKYIKALKLIENTKNVYIYLAKTKNANINQLKKLFANKNIIIKEDKTLLAGIKVVNNDIVYENNIKNNLNNLVNFINQ